jgi:hypothetical protein
MCQERRGLIPLIPFDEPDAPATMPWQAQFALNCSAIQLLSLIPLRRLDRASRTGGRRAISTLREKKNVG